VLLVQLRRFYEAGTALLAQAIAVATDGDDLAVMQQVIKDGGRHDRLAEHGAPLADRAIAGEQHAATFVAPRDELEEEMRGIGLEGEIPQLIDSC
jgi:hypothetical protein